MKKSKYNRLTLESFLLKILNSSIRFLRILGFSIWDFNPDDIIEKVIEESGLEDLGDERFLEGVQASYKNYQKVEMSPAGDFAFRFMLRNICLNRLKIEEYLKTHPEVTQQKITQPIFVVGLPRNGTSLLQNVLSQGKKYRGLHLWEMATPYPLDDDPVRDKEKKIQRLEAALKLVKFASPRINTAHELKIDSIQECWLLMINSLSIINQDWWTDLKEWNDWIAAQDRSWAYEEYKRLLQINCATTVDEADYLVLKCPTHLWSLNYLAKTFPRAKFVWIHRNPIKSVVSFSSLKRMIRTIFYDKIDPIKVGSETLENFVEGTKKGIEFHDQLTPERILDVKYEEFIKDIPLGVKKIRDYFGFPHTKEDDQAIIEYLNIPKEDAPGNHKYSIEEWGLTEDEIFQEMSHYIGRFNIPTNHKQTSASIDDIKSDETIPSSEMYLKH